MISDKITQQLPFDNYHYNSIFTVLIFPSLFIRVEIIILY